MIHKGLMGHTRKHYEQGEKEEERFTQANLLVQLCSPFQAARYTSQAMCSKFPSPALPYPPASSMSSKICGM
jgi:hypothetical protein